MFSRCNLKTTTLLMVAGCLTFACSKQTITELIDKPAPKQKNNEPTGDTPSNDSETSANAIVETSEALTISEIPDMEMTNNSAGRKILSFDIFGLKSENDCRKILKAESSNEKILSSSRILFISEQRPSCKAFISGNPGESGTTQITFSASEGKREFKRSFSVTVKHSNEPPTIYVRYPKTVTLGTVPLVSLDVSDPDSPPGACNSQTIFSEVTVGTGIVRSTEITGQWPKCFIKFEPNTESTGRIFGWIWTSDGTDSSQKDYFDISIVAPQTANPTPSPTQAPTDPKVIEEALVKYAFTGVLDANRMCVATLKSDHDHKFFDKVVTTLKAGEKYAGRPDILAEYFTLIKFVDNDLNYIRVENVPTSKVDYNCSYAKFVYPVATHYAVALRDLNLYSDPSATTKACTIQKGTSRKIELYSILGIVSNSNSTFIWEVKLNEPTAACASVAGKLYLKRAFGENPFIYNGIGYNTNPELQLLMKQ